MADGGQNMFDRSPTIVGSGMFACDPLVYQQVTLTAPFLKPAAALAPQQTETGPEAARFAAYMKKSPEVFPVSQVLLARYAAKLVEVSRLVKESAYDIVLCPMRGARMAGLQVDLICSTEPIQAFDGSDMGKGINVERILSDLRALIYEHPPALDVREIGVLDTAVGGDSCREFARLLRLLNERGKEKWRVRFHLIHAEGKEPPRANQARQFASKKLEIEIWFHPVDSLLIEDEEKLLGYDVSRSAGESHVVRYQQEGQLLVFSLDKVTLYHRAPLDESMIALVSDAIAGSIQQTPDIKPVNLDHWPFGR
jgi:hypothetical protein